jgi:Flp pilus assembly CpaF family ATPase
LVSNRFARELHQWSITGGTGTGKTTLTGLLAKFIPEDEGIATVC